MEDVLGGREARNAARSKLVCRLRVGAGLEADEVDGSCGKEEEEEEEDGDGEGAGEKVACTLR